MAIVRPLDDKLWNEWVASRPPIVQELCRRFPPDRLYRMRPTGQRVTLYAYNEDGTVTVFVSGEYNAVILERNVFGVDPNNLEECDLPTEDEKLGVLLTEDAEIDEYISYWKAKVRQPRANFVMVPKKL